MPSRRHDFEASLCFLSPEEGGRQTPVRQGYRADFRYLDDLVGTAWMIHAREFIDENGKLLPEGLPIFGNINARMYIVTDYYRVSEHRKRLNIGTQFQVVEGSHVIAEGIVTKIVGLYDD